ncbi:MAG: US12 family protein [Thermoguttaceae bacterium]|nr:US12 family protein [Thermoguttaceae bacterium]
MEYRNSQESYEIYDASESGVFRATREVAVDQASFIKNVYLHLTGAVASFAALEAAIFALVGVAPIASFMQEHARLTSLILLGLCLGGPALGQALIGSNPSKRAQYFLLAFYVMLYAAIFLPILTFAQILTGDASLIWQAVGLTVALFIALSAAVFMTRKDFSFLRTSLAFVGLAAIILIVASFIFNFYLGTWFSVAMILFACGYVLYGTSNIIHHCGPGDEVFASIELFASVMTLFYYILRILMAFNRR